MGGGRTRTRTLDPLIKSQLLYQLSYAPAKVSLRVAKGARWCKAFVGLGSVGGAEAVDLDVAVEVDAHDDAETEQDREQGGAAVGDQRQGHADDG